MGHGSFEAPDLANGAFAYGPSGTDWTYAGQAGVATNGSAFGNPPAPEGERVALLRRD